MVYDITKTTHSKSAHDDDMIEKIVRGEIFISKA